MTIDVGVQIVGAGHVSIGDNTWIDKYVILLAGPLREGRRKVHRRPNPHYQGQEGELVIGRNCHIAPYVLLQAHGGLWLGDDVGVAAGSKIYSLSHHHRNLEEPADTREYVFTPCGLEEDQALIASPVVVGSRAAVALDVCILPGSTVGRGSWVGAKSLVSGEVPPGVIAAGVPVRVIRSRGVLA